MIKTCLTRCAMVAWVIGFTVLICGCDQLTSIIFAPDEWKDDPDEWKDDGIDVLYEPFTVNIGLSLPMTGVHAVSFGQSMQRGFNLARDEINNSQLNPVRLNFIVEDDMSTVAGTVGAVQRLIQASVPAIVGMPISTHAKQAFPIAQEHQVVAFSSVSAAAGLSSIGDYIFRAALATDKLNPAGVRTTHAKLRYERVAMLYDHADVFSTSSNEQLTVALEELGVEVAITQTFQTGDADFSPQFTKIRESNPDALFVSSVASDLAKIMVQGRENEIAAPYIIPGLAMNQVQLAGAAAEGTITFHSWSNAVDNPLNKIFVENFQTAYGVEPDAWAALSYAALTILHRALVEAVIINPQQPDAMAIRSALAATTEFDTILGSFSFDPNGEALYEPVVLMVKDGQLTDPMQ
ncbi:MAG: ABC transporter substrate-binding protein [Candidatus Poribacteria bacterium]|nr:ABC transporter substrate-binding protein [Candidatus Poribacteria bacterium]